MRTSDIAFSDLLLLVHVRHHWLDDVDVSDGSVRMQAPAADVIHQGRTSSH